MIFVVGAAWLYHGVAGFSVPAANIIGGSICLAVGAFPYVKPKRKS